MRPTIWWFASVSCVVLAVSGCMAESENPARLRDAPTSDTAMAAPAAMPPDPGTGTTGATTDLAADVYDSTGMGATTTPLPPPPIIARQPSEQPGMVATGIIVHETDESLELDPTPCVRDSIRYTFYPPYRKSRLGTGRCNGRAYERYQVIEQKPNSPR